MKDHEKCTLLRRRLGLTQSQVADKVACCRRWVNLMEQGAEDCSRLVSYYKELNFGKWV